MDKEERARLIAMAIAAGYQVYQRKAETDTWFLYTDGTNIGYCQFPGREPEKLCTVHKPNTNTGTGFVFTERWEPITPKAMENCATVHAPRWATDADRRATVKWKSWDEFHNADQWNRGYMQVTE